MGGGSANLGALFRITPDGVYTVVYNFQGLDDGTYPAYSPIQASDGNLYGAAGGVYGQNDGTIYKYSAAGSITTVFALSADGTQGTYFSSPPIQGADSNLYATTSEGGAFGCGTILKLNTAGGFSSSTTSGARSTVPVLPVSCRLPTEISMAPPRKAGSTRPAATPVVAPYSK